MSGKVVSSRGLSIELPASCNNVAKRALELSDRLVQSIPQNVDAGAVMTSIVGALNMLRFDRAEDYMNPATIRSAIIAANNAALVGLPIGAPFGYAYFIPYTMNYGKKGQHVVVNYIPGYRGFLELAFANGFITRCSSEVVLRGEKCKRVHVESGPKIRHEIAVPRDQATRENVIGAYCTYTTSAGGNSFCYVERHEIDDVDTHKNIWQSDYVPMVLKTPVRRAAKMWRLSREFSLAIQLDEQADRQAKDGGGGQDGIDLSDDWQTIDLNAVVVE